MAYFSTPNVYIMPKICLCNLGKAPYTKLKTPLAASTFNLAPPKALNGTARMRLLNFVDLLQKSRCYHTAILAFIP